MSVLFPASVSLLLVCTSSFVYSKLVRNSKYSFLVFSNDFRALHDLLWPVECNKNIPHSQKLEASASHSKNSLMACASRKLQEIAYRGNKKKKKERTSWMTHQSSLNSKQPQEKMSLNSGSIKLQCKKFLSTLTMKCQFSSLFLYLEK